jgi:DNA-binding NarL/FixJ family response regulator
MGKIKIVVCDDMKQIRDYFSMIIESEQDMELVGVASSATEVVKLVKETQPDIALVDIQMESEDSGILATEQIKMEFPDVKVVIITIHEEDELIFRAYGAGAVDYILKTSSVTEILNSIRNVYKDEFFIRPFVTQKIMGEFTRLQNEKDSLMYTVMIMTKLTNAEIEILKAIYNGSTRKEIALQRSVEVVTIDTQIGNILKKFGYKNSKELIKTLRQLKVFELFDKGKGI